MTAYGEILWRPTEARQRASALHRFLAFVNGRHGMALADYPALQAWSVAETGAFWAAVAEFCGVVWQKAPERAFAPPPAGRMRGGAFFPGSRLNFAENLLARLGAPERVVLTARAEGAPRREFTAAALRDAVTRCASALAAAGVGPGDRVAGVIANVPEALIAMLATTSLGGVWASCSPDFGAAAVIDRLGQVAPKVLFFTAHYQYGGKTIDGAAVATAVRAALPSVVRAVVVDHIGEKRSVPGFDPWHSFLSSAPARPLTFAPRAFDDPVYILFSSGTTGVPKCITHGVGGTLVQHLKELLLHGDVGPDARLLYYTTCGWMMWNWMASSLAAGASLVLFDGSVASPDLGVLWRAVAEERVTAFGTSPKFLAACAAANVAPRTYLGAHRPATLFSTGSPLLPEQFTWVYEHLGPDLHLASISGGTDIVSCFMLGNPLMPVRAGEIQYAGLGMAVDAWDESRRSVRGAKGELVCTKPFPSMPVKFWNDPDGKKYDAAYFGYYDGPEVWRHGDFVEITEHGGIVVYGRSDATLNPGGVRIGTAELYRALEAVPEVEDAVAIGKRVDDGDTDIWLFVKLKGAVRLDAALEKAIKTTLRTTLTPRHVPKRVVQVKDIPYTRSGKKMELAVTQAVHGEEIANIAAVANPECIAEFAAVGRGAGA